MKRILVASSLALAGMIAAPGSASAASFVGQIDYVGVHTADNANLNLATQTAINSANVLISTGSFAANGIAVTDALAHQSPIVFRPVAGTPYAPLWTHVASGISFDLGSMNITFSSKKQLNLTGNGTFHCAAPCVGLDDTPGSWNMTINTAGNVTGTFSSSASVPEPASLALFGLGMFGAAAAARRRRRQA